MALNDRNAIIERIRALRAKAGDSAATEAEAFEAAAFAARLIMKHEITEADLADIKAEGAVKDGYAAKGKELHPVLRTCWSGIQAVCEVKAYAEGNRLCFIGTREDVMLAGYYAEMFVGASLRVWNDHFETLPKMGFKELAAQRDSLYAGFGSRLAQRLRDLAQERKDAVKSASGNQLVVVKSHLIKEKMAEMGLTLKKNRSKSRIADPKAYNAGANVANRVNLNSPLGGRDNMETIE